MYAINIVSGDGVLTTIKSLIARDHIDIYSIHTDARVMPLCAMTMHEDEEEEEEEAQEAPLFLWCQQWASLYFSRDSSDISQRNITYNYL